MGILDDAIREHLELKRQHGASEGEVAREEAEALGPVKKAWSAEEGAEGSPEARAGAPEAGEGAAPEAREGAPEGPPASEAGAGEAPAPAPPPEPQPPVSIPEPPGEPGGLYDVEAEGGAALRPSRAESAEPEPWLEPEAEPAAVPEEEDVLEETPEFLEETPEHDRLWFEQKPPKEFDFGD